MILGYPPRPPRRSKKGGQASFHNEVRQEIEPLIGPCSAQGTDFETLKARLNADRSDFLEPGGIAPATLRRAMWTGEAKPLRRFWDRCDWNEPIYHCPACGNGFSPRDGSLGIQQSSLSPGVMRMVANVAARVSFNESSTILGEQADERADERAAVTVDPKQIECRAEALGREVAADVVSRNGRNRDSHPLR